MENLNEVNIEIKKGQFLKINKEKAIEIAVNEFFKNGKCLNINGKDFDIMEYGGSWKDKLSIN